MKAVTFLKFVELNGITNCQYNLETLSKSESVFRYFRDRYRIKYIARCVYPEFLSLFDAPETDYVVYFPREVDLKQNPMDPDSIDLARLLESDWSAPDLECAIDLDKIPFIGITEDDVVLWIFRIV